MPQAGKSLRSRKRGQSQLQNLLPPLLLTLLLLIPSRGLTATWFYDAEPSGGAAGSDEHSFKTPETKNSHKSQSTELVQHFRTDDGHGNVAHRQLVFLALLPSVESDNKNDCIMPKVLPVLELGIRHIQNLGFVGGTHFDIQLISRDTFCSSKYGPIGFFEIYTQWPEVNAVFGLPCEYVLAPISRYADVWQVPVLTTGGNAKEFNKKSESYSTLTRLKGAQVNNLGNVVRAILNSFNWTRTALIYQNENAKVKGNSVCFLCLAAIHDTIEEHSVYQLGFDTSTWTKADITRMLKNVAMQTRSK